MQIYYLLFILAYIYIDHTYESLVYGTLHYYIAVSTI